MTKTQAERAKHARLAKAVRELASALHVHDYTVFVAFAIAKRECLTQQYLRDYGTIAIDELSHLVLKG